MLKSRTAKIGYRAGGDAALREISRRKPFGSYNSRSFCSDHGRDIVGR